MSIISHSILKWFSLERRKIQCKIFKQQKTHHVVEVEGIKRNIFITPQVARIRLFTIIIADKGLENFSVIKNVKLFK